MFRRALKSESAGQFPRSRIIIAGDFGELRNGRAGIHAEKRVERAAVRVERDFCSGGGGPCVPDRFAAGAGATRVSPDSRVASALQPIAVKLVPDTTAALAKLSLSCTMKICWPTATVREPATLRLIFPPASVAVA